MMIRLLLSVFVACATIFAHAQLQESDTARWQLTAGIAGRLNTGNFERLIITPEYNASHISLKGNYGFSANQRYSYGTFGAFVTEQDLLSRNFFYINPKRKAYPFLMLWINTHEQQKLISRIQYGVGYSFVLLKNKLHFLKLSGTVSYEENRYREGGLTYIDPNSTTYDTWRGTFRISGNHFTKGKEVNFFYEGYFQQALNSKDNFRFYGETGLIIPVIKGFSLRSFLSYEYQTVHISKIKPNDLIMNMGINYRWAERK